MYKDKDGRIHETATEARDGSNVKGVTTVLFVSLALVIVIFVIVYWSGRL